MIFRITAVLIPLLSLVACSDDGFSVFPPFYTLQTIATGSHTLVELNEAGHALLGTGTSSLLWNGQHLREVPVSQPFDLGPDDGVVGLDDDGRVLYWRDGVFTELTVWGRPLGITSTGAAYYRDMAEGEPPLGGRLYSWSDGTQEPVPNVPSVTRIVGDDGVIYGTKHQCGFGECYDSGWAFIDGDTIGIDRALGIGFLAAPGNRHVAYSARGGGQESRVWHDGEVRRFWRRVGGLQYHAQIDVNSNGVVLVEGGLLVDGADSVDVRRLGVPDYWTTIGHGQLNDAGQLLLQVSNETDSAVVLLTPTTF